MEPVRSEVKIEVLGRKWRFFISFVWKWGMFKVEDNQSAEDNCATEINVSELRSNGEYVWPCERNFMTE